MNTKKVTTITVSTSMMVAATSAMASIQSPLDIEKLAKHKVPDELKDAVRSAMNKKQYREGYLGKLMPSLANNLTNKDGKISDRFDLIALNNNYGTVPGTSPGASSGGISQDDSDLVNSTNSQVGATSYCYNACHSNCYGACHGSRGWR